MLTLVQVAEILVKVSNVFGWQVSGLVSQFEAWGLTDNVERPMFDFVIDAADVFADDT